MLEIASHSKAEVGDEDNQISFLFYNTHKMGVSNIGVGFQCLWTTNQQTQSIINDTILFTLKIFHFFSFHVFVCMVYVHACVCICVCMHVDDCMYTVCVWRMETEL